jgi:hypothetical protein
MPHRDVRDSDQPSPVCLSDQVVTNLLRLLRFVCGNVKVRRVADDVPGYRDVIVERAGASLVRREKFGRRNG